MELIKNLAKWQGVASYFSTRKNLPSWGKTGIMVGIFNLALGGLTLLMGKDDLLFMLLMLIGLFMLIIGIWGIAAPSPIVILFFGFGWMIWGMWIVFFTLDKIANSGNWFHAVFTVIGIWQISLSLKIFRLYRVYSALPWVKASPVEIGHLEDLIDYIKQDIQDFVEFETGSLWKSFRWKGKFFKNVVVIIHQTGKDVWLTPREELTWVKKGNISKKGKLKVIFKFKNRTMKTRTTPLSLQKFERWKFGGG